MEDSDNDNDDDENEVIGDAEKVVKQAAVVGADGNKDVVADGENSHNSNTKSMIDDELNLAKEIAERND